MDPDLEENLGSRGSPDGPFVPMIGANSSSGTLVGRAGVAGGSEEAKKRRRRTTFGGIKSDSDRILHLKDIVAVHHDYATDVMQRSLQKQFVSNEQSTCVISIVLSSRHTLDFEIEELHWGPIYHSLQILVNFYT